MSINIQIQFDPFVTVHIRKLAGEYIKNSSFSKSAGFQTSNCWTLDIFGVFFAVLAGIFNKNRQKITNAFHRRNSREGGGGGSATVATNLALGELTRLDGWRLRS